MRHQCSRCRLMFCDQHLSEVSVIEGRGASRRRVHVLVCAYCRARARYWN